MERGEGIAADSTTSSACLLNDKHAMPKESAPAASDGIAEQRPGPKSTTEEDIEAMSQPAAVGKKKKVVRVKQGYIDWLLSHPDTHKPYRPMPQELIDNVEPEFGVLMARVTARQQKIRNRHADFLEQYRIKGYAEEEIEVSDDEEEDEVVGT